MDNVNQVSRTDVEQIKDIFLSEELLVKSAKPEIYSLPDEFAKSRRNKNYFVYSLVLLYIAAIGTGVYAITAIQENKNKSIEVNIAEFRQFNLVELLEEKKMNEEKLVKLQEEMQIFREKALKEIERLSPEEQAKAMAALNEKMNALEQSYKQQMKEQEQTIQTLEKMIGEARQRLGMEGFGELQNAGREQGMEIGLLKADYEGKITKLKAQLDETVLRYNPVFSRGEIADVISARSGNVPNAELNKYSKILMEGAWSEQNLDQLRKKIRGQRVVIDALRQIPYVNSIPAALNRLDQLTKSIIADYENLWGSLADQIKKKNEDLGSYEYALNYLSMSQRENGYVIDARNTKQIAVYINRIYSVKKGDTAYIFKGDNVAVAKITLNPERNRITAKVAEMLRPVKIEPFDKILLKLEVGS
ncbi:MAG: hypothetical protein ACM3WV_07790 [Bacillota bacterium]